jgi:type VI secretion system secreted protein VgrG
MDLQAQNGDLTLAAADNLRIYANQAEMLLLAGKKLTLMCGGSYLTLSPGSAPVSQKSTYEALRTS